MTISVPCLSVVIFEWVTWFSVLRKRSTFFDIVVVYKAWDIPTVTSVVAVICVLLKTVSNVLMLTLCRMHISIY